MVQFRRKSWIRNSWARIGFLAITVILLIIFYNYSFIKFDSHPDSSPVTPPLTEENKLWILRKAAVRKAFKHAWKGYVRDAWGSDEYHPLSRSGTNFTGEDGIGYTIIDSLDTMLIMGLEEEYLQAREWVAENLDFDKTGNFNLFETTIRVLGGLLSTYHLSNDALYLTKAKDLGDRLLAAFTTSSDIPYASVDLASYTGIRAHFGDGASSTSEVTTIQLEFKYLSHLTGDDKYWRRVEQVMFRLDDLEKLDGLVPIYISPYTGDFVGQTITLGARGDSYYEYLLKQYLQTARTEPFYRRMYDEAMNGVKNRLLAFSAPNKYMYIGELMSYSNKDIHPKMDHLVCFLGGVLALGVTGGKPLADVSNLSKKDRNHLEMATSLTETCAEMYFSTETGLAPEITYFEMNPEGENDLIIHPGDGHSLLRPETIESFMILWRITGDVRYREWGWTIFQAFEKYAKLEDGGYTSLDNVNALPPPRRDKMETFWLSETLKYLYLLFDDSNLIPLDKYVFNTEAHPLPIFEPLQNVRGKGWSHY